MASGTITGAKYISDHYYLKLVWSSTSNALTNKSSVTAKLYFHADPGWTISISNHSGTIVVNGNTKNITGSVSSTGDTLLASYDNVSVTHNSNGTKSISLSATFKASVTISGHGTIGTMTVPSTTVALDNIDRTAPSITASISYVSAGKISITGTTTVNCSTWQYRVGSGSWTTLSSSSSVTSASKSSVTLTTGASYSISVRATKDSNGVVGTSQAVTADLNAPTVTGSVAYQGGGAIRITANSNKTADKWEYKLGSGAWTSFSTTASTSQTTANITPAAGSYTTYVRATRQLNDLVGTSSAFTVDTSAPTVTLALSNITTNSVKLTATTTYSCDYWEYRYKVGSGSYNAWGNFSSASGTSKTYTQTGLSPNQSYTFQVRARRASNQVKGTSSAKSATTIGASVLTSVPALQIDNTTTIALGITVYSTSFYHKLTIQDGGTPVGSPISIGKISSTGSVTQNVNLSSLKNDILDTMTTVTSKSLTFLLGTYSDSGYTTQIGSDSSKAGTIKVSSTYSAPIFTGGLTFDDTNLTIKGLTGGDAYVQGLSTLKVTFNSATAQSRATISSYTTTVGAKSVVGSSPVSFGAINTNGSSTGVTVTATDSRGFTKTQSDTIDVIEYYPPEISQLTIVRVNNYEDVAVLNIDGSYSPVDFNGSPLNNIPSSQITYRMKAVGGSWGAYQTITLTVDPSDQTFTYSSNTFESGNLDRTKEYQFEFVITDALGGSLTVTRNLPDGTPVMSLRKGKVGINNPSPGGALEVGNNLLIADEVTGSVGVNTVPVNNGTFEVGGNAYVDGELHGVEVYTKSPGNNNSPSVFFMDSDADYLGRMYFTRDSSSSPRRIVFSTQKNNGTNIENYRLPIPDVGTATDIVYEIFTNKMEQYTLLTTENLNNLTTMGTYRQSLNANATTARNYPVSYAGMLEVFAVTSTMIFQRYTTYRSPENSNVVALYIRNYYNGWKNWTRVV